MLDGTSQALLALVANLSICYTDCKALLLIILPKSNISEKSYFLKVISDITHLDGGLQLTFNNNSISVLLDNPTLLIFREISSSRIRNYVASLNDWNKLQISHPSPQELSIFNRIRTQNDSFEKLIIYLLLYFQRKLTCIICKLFCSIFILLLLMIQKEIRMITINSFSN